jgi:hypothetical protein
MRMGVYASSGFPTKSNHSLNHVVVEMVLVLLMMILTIDKNNYTSLARIHPTISDDSFHSCKVGRSAVASLPFCHSMLYDEP